MVLPLQQPVVRSTSGSVTVPFPAAPPPPTPQGSFGGPMYAGSGPISAVYPRMSLPNSPLTGPWIYQGPTAVIGGSGGMPGNPNVVASGVSSFNAGMGNFMQSVFDQIASGVNWVTQTGAEYGRALNDIVQPITQSVWDLGQTVSAVGYTGLAFDSDDDLGFSRIVDTGERISKGAGKVSKQSESAKQRLESIASGDVVGDPVGVGAERYQRIQDQRKKKKQRRNQPQAQNQSRRRRRSRGTGSTPRFTQVN